MLNTPFPPWPSYTTEEVDAVSRVLLSNKVNYWTGQECRKFEKEFAAWSGCSYAVALANGTLALEIASDEEKLASEYSHSKVRGWARRGRPWGPCHPIGGRPDVAKRAVGSEAPKQPQPPVEGHEGGIGAACECGLRGD